MRGRRSIFWRRRQRGRLLGWALIGVCVAAAAAAQSCQTAPRTATRAPAPAVLPAPSVDPSEIRVRIVKATDTIEIDGPASVLATRSLGERGRTFPTPAVVRIKEDGFVVRDARGGEFTVSSAAPLLLAPVGIRSIEVNGIPYPGRIELIPQRSVSLGVFDVVETAALEDYLPGVVAKELYRDWKPAAYEAQAIAARSYAMHERTRQRAAGSHFDIEATEADQVYGGAATHQTALEAVRRTRGVILTWAGGPLRAYYSSTCGGRAGSARDTWPTGPGFEFNLADPIQAHDRACACEFSPLHRWSVRRDPADLAKRFAAFGRDQGLAVRSIKSIARVEQTQLNPVGRPQKHRVFDADGKWWELSAEQFRLACNYTAGGAIPAPTRAERVNSGDAELRIEQGAAVISGRGFGHGVGLCQFGAEGMARQGRKADEILRHFYPGATIERAY